MLGSIMEQSIQQKAISILNRVMEFELAGVVRYTHYALMVSGPHRIPLVSFLKAQAKESLAHAEQAGELLTGLEGHPTLNIAAIEETHQHSTEDILQESLDHELAALALYRDLLDTVRDASVYLEEYARGQIATEEQHTMELKKMLRDLS